MTIGFKAQCFYCKRYDVEMSTCDAFLGGVPEEILNGNHDHKKPYPGDNGIRFEAKEED